jgi:hypothetical protein
VRTTLSIDDDVLHAAKEVARAERRSAGEVISEMARVGFAQSLGTSSNASAQGALAALGIKTLPRRGSIVTQEQVNELRDELGI